MQVYIAARFNKKDEVQKLSDELESLGCRVLNDWLYHENIKPYSENPSLSREYSKEDIENVRRSDIFILISDEQGTGMYTELGVAICGHVVGNRPEMVIVTGEHTSRSMFYYHPAVNVLTKEEIINTIKELLCQD